jgi:hypothetical protein
MMEFPITLETASALGLIFVIISVRVVMARGKAAVGLGTGEGQTSIALGKENTAPPLLVAIRAHANFAEYVPISLILLALLESAHANRTFLMVTAITLIVSRLFHAVGLGMAAPNLFRLAGAGLSFVLIAAMAGYGLYLTL